MEILNVMKVPYYKKGKVIDKNKSQNVETPVDNEETYFLGTLPEVEITASASPETIRKGWELLTNEWALQNPTAIFKPKYRKQRAVLTDDTWKAIIKANNITDPADKRFKMIPTKFLEQTMLNSVREAMNDTGVKTALGALAVPGAIIGGAALANPVLSLMFYHPGTFLAETTGGIIGGLAGGTATDAITRGVSDYDSFANMIASNSTIPELYAEMLNPGMLLGGLAGGVGGNVLYNNVVKPTAQRAALPYLTAMQLNKNIRNANLGPTVFDDAVLQGKVGWAPSLTINYRHGSDKANLERFVPYVTWDVEKHGASPFKFFGTEVSSPRNMMDERPFLYFGSTELNKPMVLIGEFNPLGVKNNTRNLLVNESRRRGADSYYLQNIADNKAENQNVLIKFIGQEGEPVGKPTSIKWYGPTMGKTTATKIHDELVDIDPLLKPIRQKYANILGLDIRDPKVSQHPEYKQAVVDFILDWKMNPENQGKTLLASTKHLLDPEYKIQFGNDPSIPDFETFAARNKARGFKETDELLRAWYDSIFKQGRDLNIDNRFVLDIERPSTLTEAERLGIPKGERNQLDRMQKEALEDLFLYKNSGQYRQIPNITEDGITWGTTINGISPLLLASNIPGARIIGDSDYAFVRFPYKQHQISYYPQNNSFGAAATNSLKGGEFGELTIRPTNTKSKVADRKLILTSPRADAIGIGTAGEGSLNINNYSDVIDKNVVKSFSLVVSETSRPGTYYSGDNGLQPLGAELIRRFNLLGLPKYFIDNNGTKTVIGRESWDDIINKLLQSRPKGSFEDGLSTDSYMYLLKQGNRPGNSLRFGETPFEVFNNLGVKHKHIYDLWLQAKNGEISNLEFIKHFNEWVAPYNGMPAYVNRKGKLVIPHPYVYTRKQGGTIKYLNPFNPFNKYK